MKYECGKRRRLIQSSVARSSFRQKPEAFGKKWFWVSELVSHAHDIVDIVFSPDGRLLATTSKDNTARIWDVFSGKEVARLTGYSNFVMGSPFLLIGVL